MVPDFFRYCNFFVELKIARYDSSLRSLSDLYFITAYSGYHFWHLRMPERDQCAVYR